MIIEFDCLEDAQAWANAGPYCIQGVWQRPEVRAFKRVIF
ncbi:hypothetical protein [Glaciecola petra]